MINFFRKIRKRLLTENKFTKYLIYAIGEIVLVVIGILIALQINNWNEANQRAYKETKMLTELRTNLKKDYSDNTINIQWYRRVERSARIINHALETDLPWHDSLSVHFGNMYTHGISTLNLSAYENLKSVGFDLITNDSIRVALTDLHSISYELVRKSEEEFSKENHNTMVLPVLTTRLRMDRWFYATPHDYEGLKSDLTFQETVRFRGITMGYVGSNTASANRRVNRLISMIDRELNN